MISIQNQKHVAALVLALALSGCNLDTHSPIAEAAAETPSAPPAASSMWSELGTPAVYDGNVELYH
jgi:hypothetical protein